MSYFWVFKSEEYEEELKKGCLWAPQKGPKGRIIHHWDRVRTVKPGDIVFSSSNRKIVSINIAITEAYSDDVPLEEGIPEWECHGWRVDVIYNELVNPISVDENLEKIMSFKTEKYFPLNSQGRGNQGYLFPVEKEFGEYLLSLYKG